MAKNIGQRARFSDRLTSVHANTIQNRADIRDVMTKTQSAVKDIMKVVLATTKQTTRLADEELERLYAKRDRLQEEQDDIDGLKDWYLRHNILTTWYNLPWWKRAIHFRMRPAPWQW